jgi:hypothetical protein
MIPFPKHTLIIGATGTGKGVICHSYHKWFLDADPGHAVYLLYNKDDEGSRYGQHERLWKTKDQFEFLEAVKKCKAPKEGFCDTLAIIDEAFDWDWKKKGDGLQYVPNAARAHGVFMWVTSQFASQMSPTVRVNCDNIFCFGQKPQAAKWAAEQYSPEFAESVNLKDGCYIYQRGRESPVKGCAWYLDSNGNFHGV